MEFPTNLLISSKSSSKIFLAETEDTIIQEQEQYTKETTFEAKPSLWQRFKNSKFVKAATYVFRIKVRIELPSNALPEGRGENV